MVNRSYGTCWMTRDKTFKNGDTINGIDDTSCCISSRYPCTCSFVAAVERIDKVESPGNEYGLHKEVEWSHIQEILLWNGGRRSWLQSHQDISAPAVLSRPGKKRSKVESLGNKFGLHKKVKWSPIKIFLPVYGGRRSRFAGGRGLKVF